MDISYAVTKQLRITQNKGAVVFFIEQYNGMFWEIVAKVDGPNAWLAAHKELHRLHDQLIANTAAKARSLLAQRQ